MADISNFDLGKRPDLRGFTLGLEMRFQERPIRVFLPGHAIPVSHDPKALAQEVDAVNQMLKRGHGKYWKENPLEFRLTIQKASRRCFRVKPGPQADKERHRVIQAASRKRGRGITWKDLYAAYISDYSAMSEYTRNQAEDSFRRTVNKYLSDHPRLRKTEDGVPETI